MRSIVYFSQAAQPMTAADLRELERECVENDGRLDITGILLHKDGHFLQLIEGPDGTMRDMWARIQADPRHIGLHVVLDRVSEARALDTAAMHFRNLDTSTFSAAFPVGFNAQAFAADAEKALAAMIDYCRIA